MTEELNPLMKIQEMINSVNAAGGDIEVAHIEEDKMALYIVECLANGTYDFATLQAMARMALTVLADEDRDRWYA